MIPERGVAVVVDDIVITGKALTNVNIIEEIDLSFSTLPIGVCDVSLAISPEKHYEHFTFNKKYEVYFNGKSKGEFYVTETDRVGNDTWGIYGMNYLYFLEKETLKEDLLFPAGFTESHVYGIFDKVLSLSGVAYEIAEELKNIPAFAYIKSGKSFKDIVALLCLSHNVLAVTKGNKVSIQPYEIDLDTVDEIPPERILGNSRIEENATKTKTLTIKYLSEIDQSGNAQFDEWPQLPLNGNPSDGYLIRIGDSDIGKEFVFHGYSALNSYVEYGALKNSISAPSNDYEFTEKTTKCVRIKFYTTGTWQVRGKLFHENYLYYSSKTFNDDAVFSTTTSSVDGEDSITSLNIDEVGQRLLEKLNTSQKFNCNIAERKHVQEGELYKYGQVKYGGGKYGERRPSVVTKDNEIELGKSYAINMQKYGTHTKTVERMRYNLNGNIIVKECVLR